VSRAQRRFVSGFLTSILCVRSAPGNITLKPLSTENAEVVDDEWPNKHVASHFLVKRLIEWNQNIGAFNEDGELMGWCLRLQAGPLGALQVREKFMRKGIGSLVTLAMCKILANDGLDTFALVGNHNLASQKMFTRLGFERKDDAYWLRTLPLDGDFQWTDESVCS
jgi:ribosomal protein S18 acetylase RimI-like enzyme